MKNRKLLPLSLSIAAIGLLILGFSNVGFPAIAATDGAQNEPQTPAAPVSITAVSAAPEVNYATEAVVVQAETPACSCANPGDCGIPGCPQAACIAGGCAGQSVTEAVATSTGCLCQDGGCGQAGCPGAGCDGTNCPALQSQASCSCGGAAKATNKSCSCGAGTTTTQASTRSGGCGCGG